MPLDKSKTKGTLKSNINTEVEEAEAEAAKPFPLISKADASYVFWPETEYRCADQCINLKSQKLCAILGSLVLIDAPAGSCDYYIHGGKTDWQMPITGCITKESAGYAENPSKQGFGCKRCKWFDADALDCYRGVDKESAGPAPGIIHPNGCCNLNEPDETRGKMTRQELTNAGMGSSLDKKPSKAVTIAHATRRPRNMIARKA